MWYNIFHHAVLLVNRTFTSGPRPNRQLQSGRPLLERLEDRITPSALAYTGIDANDFVQSLYEDFLGRSRDTCHGNEGAGWVDMVNAGNISGVASGIIRSPEAAYRIVGDLYEDILGREGENAGVMAWSNQLLSGGTLEGVMAGFYGSQELANQLVTSTAFVNRLYADLLHRLPGAGEASDWVNSCESGALSRQQIVSGFVNSLEFRTYFVRDLYMDLLHRPSQPEAGELSAWANSGLDMISLQVSFASSLEYQTKAVFPNNAPSFTAGADQTVLEDAGMQTVIQWATNITTGPSRESCQSLEFLVETDNDALFAVLPTIDPVTGNLAYTPADDANGTANITVTLKDDGGIDRGGSDTSAPQTFAITITSVNDVPSFTGSNQTATTANGIAQTENNGGLGHGLLTGVLFGQSFTATDDLVNLSSIAYSYVRVNNQLKESDLVMRLYEGVGIGGRQVAQSSARPTEDTPTGTWVPFDFTGVTLTSGEVYSFSVETALTGGISGGFEATGIQENPYAGGSRLAAITGSSLGGDIRFQIAATGADVTVSPWATDLSAGPSNESGQSLTFQVTDNDNPDLFTVQPTIDASGNLTYTPAVGVTGTATITVELTDDGGTDNGGVDTSSSQTFTITILPNAEPSFTAGPDQNVLEDAGEQTVSGWATDISPGADRESGQTLTFEVTTDNDALFAVLPTIDPTTGDLTYTPADNANGEATVTVRLLDDGGTASGGDNASDPQVFTISITAVNDAPAFTVGSNQSINEVSGVSQRASNLGVSFVVSGDPRVGQSFTATDDVVDLGTISFAYHRSNLSLQNPSMVMRLYEGVGFSGTLLREVTQVVSKNTPSGTLLPFDFSGISLTSGSVYSFSIGLTNSGMVSGGYRTRNTNVYSGGTALFSTGAQNTGEDLEFEVAGASAMQTVSNFVTGISAGPSDESGQSVSFEVTTNNDSLFTVLPSIDASGNLTYAASVGVTGSATVTVVAVDDGGTANGGVDSTSKTFTIAVGS